MGKIEPPDYKGRLCNVCGKNNDVKMIVFGYVGTNSCSQIALCRECREALLERIGKQLI